MDPIQYLFGLEQFGIKFGLDNIRTICAHLGHPERAYPTVIIAGTNGKGSVAAMTDAALRAAGRHTGRSTSPHLVRLEERFAIDGQPVDTAALRDAVATVAAAIAALRASGALDTEPTFFEATTAAAFEIFRRAGVDLVVLEVGLGGRLDATNVAESDRRGDHDESISTTNAIWDRRSAISRGRRRASSSRACRSWSASGRRSPWRSSPPSAASAEPRSSRRPMA